jgi:transposase
MSQLFTSEQVFETYENSTSKFLTPFQRKVLLKHLQANLPPEYQRRLEIMLLADMGKSQTQICQILGCSQEMARYWISRAEAGLAHKWNERSLGRPKTINDQYIQRLKELVSKNPRDCGYGFQNWTAQWLSKHLANEFGIEISDRHINRLLKNMGLSTKSKNTSEKITNQNKSSGITICDLESNTEKKRPLSLNLI